MHESPKFSQALQVKLSQILRYKTLSVTTANYQEFLVLILKNSPLLRIIIEYQYTTS
jgi:hypothetical protein